MRVVLFRHAEREPLQSGNPPLTSRGQLQAQTLAKLIQMNELPAPTRMLVTSKIRTHQTFQPTAESLGLELQLAADLCEMLSSESRSDFRSRILRMLHFLENQTGVIYLCTHLDWIDESMSLIPSDSPVLSDSGPWSPAQFMVFEIHEGLWHLVKQGCVHART